MTPAFSRARTRRRHADGERLTFSASSRLVRLPSRWSSSSSRRSVRFRTIGFVISVGPGAEGAILLRRGPAMRPISQLYSNSAAVESVQPGQTRGPNMAEAARAPDNPMGTDGFEFVEYTAPDPEQLGALFEQLGFAAVARHRSKDVLLYRQGRVNFIVNREPDSFAQSFARVHGPSACAFAMRVKNAAKAYKRALELGAKPYQGKVGPMELNIPAIKGIGDSLIYLVDRYPGNGG